MMNLKTGSSAIPARGAALALVVGLTLWSPTTASPQEAVGDTLRLTLAGAVEMAAREGRTVEMARAGVQGAEARVEQRKAAYLPEVRASASRGARTFNTATLGLDFPAAPGQEPLFDPAGEVLGPIHNADFRGSVSQTLLDLSALEWIHSAGSALEASRMREAAAAQQAAATAGSAYVRALGAQARLQAQEADLALAQELVEIARELLASGVGVRLDLTRAEAQEATMNARLISARAGADRARLGLLLALDLPPETPLVLLDTLAAPSGPLPGEEEATRTALEERRDVRAADQDVLASEMATTAVRYERMPTVELGGSNGWVGRGFSGLLNTYDWSLRVSVPVFTGFRQRAKVAEQRAQARTVELRREDLRQQVAFQVRVALLDLQASEEQLGATSIQLQLAELEYQQARERFREGVAGAGDVIMAALLLNDARTLHVDALTASQSSRVALAAAQGRAVLLE
jgi:outer membrane protein